MFTNQPHPSPFRIILKILRCPASIAITGFFWLVISALNKSLGEDEARWAYVAREWFHYASPPYTKVIENKTPGIFYLMGLGEWLFGPQYWFPRIVGILCMVGTSLLLYRIGKTWKNRETGLIAMSFFLLSSACWSYDGPLTAQTESFMTFFSTFAFYWIIQHPRSESNNIKRYITAGFFMGLAIGFKQIAVTSAAAFSLFAFFEEKRWTTVQPRTWRLLSLFCLGILIATVITWIPLGISGVSLRNYFNGAWLILLKPGNFGDYPGSSARWLVRVHNFQSTLTRPDVIVFLICGIYLWRKKNSLSMQHAPVVGLLVWMIGDLLGVHASGYYFEHQFKQMLPSLALAVGLSSCTFFDALPFKSRRGSERSLLGVMWLLIFGVIVSPQMPSIKHAWEQMQHPVPSPEQITGKWLKMHTLPADYVYVVEVFSDVVQFYSGRRSSSKYYNTHYIDTGDIAEVTEDLTVRHPPHFMVLWDNHAPDWLWKIIGESFAYRLNLARFWIYENEKYQ